MKKDIEAKFKAIVANAKSMREASMRQLAELTKDAPPEMLKVARDAQKTCDEAIKTGDTTKLNGVMDSILNSARNATRSNK